MDDPRPAYATLLVEGPKDGIAVCTFHRPEVRNALNLEMVGEIRALLTDLRGWDDLRALIFTGAGGTFLAGADVRELLQRGRDDALRRINAGLFREIERMPVPTIAAIRGHAVGGGCELAMACDLRVCGEGARFGQPEVGLGIIPGAGATYRLPRLVGVGRAKEMIYTGRMVDAREALAIGLVNRVVPDAEVNVAARKMAAEIARSGALAVRLAKRAIDAGSDPAVEAGLALESAMQAVLFEDDEKRVRMRAFLDRKKRKETGRS